MPKRAPLRDIWSRGVSKEWRVAKVWVGDLESAAGEFCMEEEGQDPDLCQSS